MTRVKTTYEIQRQSHGQFGTARAPQEDAQSVLQELNAMRINDPKGTHRVIERRERIVDLNGMLGATNLPSIG